jgi:putative ABC transport system permease protein
MSDLRFLLRRKSLTAVAVVTMALALAANTAALSVLDAFLRSSLGVPDPDRLVLVTPERDLPGRGTVPFAEAYPNYELLRATQKTFSELAVFLALPASWADGSQSRSLDAARVSAGFFRTVRVQPIVGRTFSGTEEGPSPAPVVIISYALWQSAYASDPAIVGRTMTLDGQPCRVIGVMPAGFSLPLPTDVWLPFDIPPQQRVNVTGARQLTVYGRIADGVSAEAAAADVQRFAARAIEARPADNKDYRYSIRTIRSVLLNGADSSAFFVQAGAAILLILAILNLSTLLVAWGFERSREMAVRQALGAAGGDVTRLLFKQSAVIVGIGAALGVVLAFLSLRVLQQFDFGPTVTILLRRSHVGVSVLAATAAIASVAALAAGALPAWFSRRGELAQALRASSRSATLSGSALRWQQGMVVCQAGLSTAILAASLLVGVSFWRLLGVPDGFAPGAKVVARVVLPDAIYARHPDRATFGRTLAANLAAQPELAKSGFTTTLPVSDIASGSRFLPELTDGTTQGDPLLLHIRRVSSGYMAAMAIPILRGRSIEAADDSAKDNVAIVSRALAARLWPGEEAIGKRLMRIQPGNPPTPFTVIGIAGNTMDGGYGAPPGETVYVPYSQVSQARLSIVAEPRTPNGAAALAAIERALKATDPRLSLSRTASLGDLVQQANALPRLRVFVLALFSIVGIGIVLLGSYGVMMQLVSNRERELAVRLVFGARPSQLGAAVVAQMARLATIGAAAGLVGVWAAGGVLSAFVFGVASRSVAIYASAAVILLLVAAAAATPAAARAMRVDIRRGLSG